MLLLCNYLFSETDYYATGYSGIELFFPSKNNKFIPGIKTRLALPFHFFSEINKDNWKELSISSQLSWGSRLLITGGNISISGSYSLLNNPQITLPATVFSGLSFSEGGINGNLSSFSSPSSTYGLTSSILLNKEGKVPVLLQLGIREENPFAASFTIPFTVNTINFSLISLGGFCHLDSSIPSTDDSWFVKDIPYKEEINFGFVQEIRMSVNKNRLQIICGGFTSPYKNMNLWSKVIGSYSLGNFLLKGGFYCGEKNMISVTGKQLNKNLQWYFNPQWVYSLKRIKYGKIKFGSMFAAERNVVKDINQISYMEGKAKVGIEFYIPAFTFRITGGYEGFYLSKGWEEFFDSTEESYKGKIEFSIRKIPYISTINTDLTLNYYPNKHKTESNFNISMRPYNSQKKGWKQIVPSLSISTDLIFLEAKYKSCRIETKALWQIRKGNFTIRGSLGCKLKNS